MALVPSYIKNLANYVPGKPIEDVQRELGLKNVIKLASNENSLGPSPRALAAMKKAMTTIHRYPDAAGYSLRKKLARRFDLNIENVILGAGSEGIMSTIMRTFLLKNDQIISAANSFIGFRVLANASGHKIHWVPMENYRYDLESMAAKINNNTKIIYLANPDNPMGTYFTEQEFDDFYKFVPQRTLIIMDEAYHEYAEGKKGYPDSMNYRYDNIITLRTFSKAYGLAGVRIGYGFAHTELIENLLKVKVPFEPSFPAQVGGYAALDDTEFLERTLEINRQGMNFLYGELNDLGLKAIPSAANFITLSFESEARAGQITHSLLKKGVIVRHLLAFGWPECIRVSVGLAQENIRFIRALEACI
ncbi:MAG: histidinol-phosphate transaminase [Candidatus Neomarinimicrobiota bacterium]